MSSHRSTQTWHFRVEIRPDYDIAGRFHVEALLGPQGRNVLWIVDTNEIQPESQHPVSDWIVPFYNKAHRLCRSWKIDKNLSLIIIDFENMEYIAKVRREERNHSRRHIEKFTEEEKELVLRKKRRSIPES